MSSLADLSARIKGDVVTPDHPDYEKSLHRWSRNAEKNAAVIVFVKDSNDVAAAIHHARTNKLPIAIHGGGHDTNGASSAEGGLVIDLARHLAGVRIDPAKKLAYVEGGALWSTLDKAAIEHGLAVVGGSVNHVCFTFLCANSLIDDDIDWCYRVSLVKFCGKTYTTQIYPADLPLRVDSAGLAASKGSPLTA